MSKFIQYLAARLRWIKLTNWRNHLKNYQCVIQYFCSIPASLVTKYHFQHIETWSSTQKSVNKCKFKKKYIILLGKLTFCFSTISVFFRLDATQRREKNLCEQPFAFPMSIKTNAKCNHSTTLRQRECKTKTKKTHTHHQQQPKQQQQQQQKQPKKYV